MIASVFTLLTPMATRWSPVALILLRILEGLVLVSLKICIKLEIMCDGVSIRAGLSSGILERKMVNFKLGRQRKEKLFDLSQRERKKKNPSFGEKLNPRPSDYRFHTPPLSYREIVRR